ncbi:ubiquitin-conjugating enzyme E2 29-like [Eutrema salsugineum]|uniref:ubiquitin-conjugating enzyme E2 29-like n=1 Tax=Eutrema salsugineum TaxID=72664 RepID=UPI000CED5D51|nr:ubiquitin-conjugating enzyme E2 29-like [Eutrema salsugineum]
MPQYWERAITIQQKEIEKPNRLILEESKVGLDFPPDYPFKPLKVFFTTKLFHPNVGERGHIFLRMLTVDRFSPIHTIHTILSKLHEMLTNPEIDEGDYYDEAKAKLYKEDKAGFDQRARECTLEHAGP